MDRYLARGHANQVLRSLPSIADTHGWMHTPQRRRAAIDFDRIAQQKKPTRALSKLRPSIPPMFPRLRLGGWNRTSRKIRAIAWSAANESEVIEAQADVTLFDEKAAFVSEVWFEWTPADTTTGMSTYASISRHAIQRLLQRDASTPEILAADIKHALDLASALCRAVWVDGRDMKETWAHLLPFKGGALAIVQLRTSPGAGLGDVRYHVMSIRTFLPGDMLAPSHQERIAGFRPELLEREGADDTKGQSWLANNAIPWRHIRDEGKTGRSGASVR